eukprot:TRINITY_DN7407_c0_g1_i9.p2 TRINITY_DN7407_c0_g1~~TRINITY_DN7407_c0_g1_i9.p2  ORF type:complete len:262 (-),score=90.99 TRINITY_DN7407_c0_g1_i9:185-970(-)
MVVINPNNPTGSVLPLEHMWGIIRFAYKHRITIIADEVYQHNVYFGNKFISFRKAVNTIEAPYNNVSVISMNSISKGFTGECGIRGGYMDFYNIDSDVMKQIHKIRDACSVNVAGSIAMGVLCDPPTIENSSKETAEQYAKEKSTILSLIEQKAKMTMEVFNQCKNIKCKPIAGALYAFPRVLLPNSVIKAARESGQEPCEYFCKAMLEETGIVTVPGCGFGQEPGTYHFRVSLLIWNLEEFAKVLETMKNFINKYFETHK